MKTTTAARLLTGVLLGLANASAAADTTVIYKSVDADGTTIFTDQAVPEATIVTPPPLNVVDHPPAANVRTRQASPTSVPDMTEVNSVSIVSPAHQQTFIDPQTPLWVDFDTSPADTLPVGLSAQVLLNGRILSTGNGNRLPIDIPERGTHRVQIRLVDASGNVQAESDAIDIHVRHHTSGSSH